MNNKWQNRFIELAKVVSTWSKDPSTQIGAVIVDPKTRNILSVGYNGFPRGMNDFNDRLQNREIKYRYVVHGEHNAILNAALNGVKLEGSQLYVYGLPICNECAKAIIQVGIKEVYAFVTHDNPIWEESTKYSKIMFQETEVKYEIISGVIGP